MLIDDIELVEETAAMIRIRAFASMGHVIFARSREACLQVAFCSFHFAPARCLIFAEKQQFRHLNAPMHHPRRCLGFLALFLLLAAETRAQPLPEARGVWVHENHYSDLEGTFSRLADAGINIAYLRTWYQGRTVYPSDVVEAAGGARQHTAFIGRDPIQEAIDVAEKYGISVAAWMEYGLVAQVGYASGDVCPAPSGILAENPDWSMVDRQGRVAVPSSGPGSLCFFWMDPAHPEVIGFMADKAREIAERYPQLDIYEADRFRYPSYDWSYSEMSIQRYMDETGNPDPSTLPANDADYLAWRRGRTTELMREVNRAVKEANPSMLVSAAVVPPYMIGGSQDKMQHWPTWADSGYVDFLEIMLYLPDSAYPNQLSLAINLAKGFPIYAGIDNSQSYDMVGQIAETRSRGVEGVIIWDGRSAIEGSDVALLGDGPFAETVRPPYDELRRDDTSAVFDGPWEHLDEGYGGSSRRLPEGSSGSAHYEFEPMRAGWYAIEGYWPGSAQNTSQMELWWFEDNPHGGIPTGLGPFDQREGDRWIHLEYVQINQPYHISLSLSGARDGDLIADAFRLVRTPAMRIVDALVVGETRIEIRLNRRIDQARMDGASVTVSGSTVRDVVVREADPETIIVTTDPLVDGAEYTIDLVHFYDEMGMWSGPLQVSAVADLAGAQITLDDGESGYNQQGAWTIVADGGWDGGGFRTADGAAANRAYWIRSMPKDGLYAVSVHLPPGDAGRATAAAYFVAHDGGTDTVHVDLQAHPGGWQELGVYRPRNGSSLVVQLNGDHSSKGEIVADAVRWQRTLSSVDAPIGPELPVFSVGSPYPNPAMTMANLPYTLDEPSFVSVEIFDLLGRRVSVASDGIHGVGRGVLYAHVDALPAGMYIIRIEARSTVSNVVRTVTYRLAVTR
jgi:uncharacterized lipoprotein YddW (UPF0748 family)